jgi:hypothetical protein
MDSGDFGSLGLWIFIASTIVASSWSKSRREAEKHETLRRIVEKTGVIDEAKLKELFSPANDEKSNPGGGYRALRITGTIIMFIGAAPAIFFGTAGLFCFFGVIPPPPRGEMVAMLSIPVGIMVLGLGVFFSSRFAEPPPDFRNQPPAG